MDEIDIIVLTHNNLGMTIRCLEALYEHTDRPFRLTIVDDSTDLTPQWIEEFKKTHDNINYIRPEEELVSGNQAINIGIKNTSSPEFVTMGNSTIVEPFWLNAAYDIMMRNDKIGVIGFKLLKATGVIEHAGICFMPGMPHHMNYGVGDYSHWHTYTRNVGIVGWALVLLRRAAIPEGGLEEKTYLGFAGYEDVDNCLTIQQQGWDIIYCGMGTAFHLAHATGLRVGMDEYAEKFEKNRRIFIEKWGDLANSKTIDSGIRVM